MAYFIGKKIYSQICSRCGGVGFALTEYAC